MDLSFPEGRSVNNMIPKTEYLGAPMRLRYPGVDTLVDIIKQKGKYGYDLVNYIDNLVMAEYWSKALVAYECLGQLLLNAGVEEWEKKACAPQWWVIFLGVLFDTQVLTIAVTEDRLKELKGLLEDWLALDCASSIGK